MKGASKGEGLGNKFLSNIREVDAIVHVVRCFEDDNIIHVDGKIGAARDIETINLELIFSDIEIIQRRIDREKKQMKGDKSLASEVEFLEKLLAHLEEGKSARSYPYTESELEMVKASPLLSNKPVIYAANLSESDFTGDIEKNEQYRAVCEIAKAENSVVLPICAQIEAEIADMSAEDKEMFLSELGLKESGLNRIIKQGYSLLGLISYLTAGVQEVRAWTITNGTKAPQAAGKIHTDFEKDLSERKSFRLTILWLAAVWRRQRKKVLSVLKARTMLCVTATLYCSDSTYNRLNRGTNLLCFGSVYKNRKKTLDKAVSF